MEKNNHEMVGSVRIPVFLFDPGAKCWGRLERF